MPTAGHRPQWATPAVGVRLAVRGVGEPLVHDTRVDHGDVARQRTEGKTWFWDLAGESVLETRIVGPDLSLVDAGNVLAPRLQGQMQLCAWSSALRL